MNTGWIVEQNIMAILAAAASFIASWAVFKIKLEHLEKRVDKIDDLKLDVELAEIKKDIKYIRVSIEKKE